MTEDTTGRNPDGSVRLPLPIATDAERVTIRTGFDTLCRRCKYGFTIVSRQRECPMKESIRVQQMTDGAAVPGGKAELASPIIMRMHSFCKHPTMMPPGYVSHGLDETVLQCDLAEPHPRPPGMSNAGTGVG